MAKCINKIPSNARLEVEAPSDDGEGNFINVPKQTRLVSEIYVKSFIDFDNDVKDDEIVILKLSHPLNFSNNIQAISSYEARSKHLPEGTMVYFYGWTELKKRGMVFNAMTVRAFISLRINNF